jgi:hypothetical protein
LAPVRHPSVEVPSTVSSGATCFVSEERRLLTR